MTSKEREQRIESYGKAYDQLAGALKQFPREMWQWKPAPDQWSIHEVIVHLADSEANGYARCRRFIAEPGQSVMGYDQEQWAKLLRYHEQSAEDALELFKWLRLASYKLIRSLPESVWSNTVTHPEYENYTFERWLDIYERHTRGHIDQMKKNYDEWRKRNHEGMRHG